MIGDQFSVFRSQDHHLILLERKAGYSAQLGWGEEREHSCPQSGWGEERGHSCPPSYNGGEAAQIQEADKVSALLSLAYWNHTPIKCFITYISSAS